VSDEGEAPVEKFRIKRKVKLEEKNLTPLEKLSGAEVIELEDYLINRIIYWMSMAETTKFATVFNAVFQTVSSLVQPQQPQPQPQPEKEEKQAVEYTPTNPLDALIYNIMSRIADGITEKIMENPEVRQFIEGLVRGSVQSTIEQMKAEALKKAGEGAEGNV